MIILVSTLLLFMILHHRYYWSVNDRDKHHDINPIYYSHRGLKINSPENTIGAFKDALDAGFNWIELDIISTRDNKIICSHNFDLERETNGVGYISELKENDLSPLYTGIYTHKNNPSKLPTLEDVVNTLPIHTGYNIEIKAPILSDMSTARALLAFLGNRPNIKCIVSSFNPFVVAYIKIFNRSIKTGFLFQNLEYFWITHWIHPTYIHPRADLIDDEMLRVAKRHNIGVNAWTVNNKDAIKWCEEMELNGIITDLEII